MKGEALIRYHHHRDIDEMTEEEFADRIAQILYAERHERSIIWGSDKK